jgi:hypothetical protein
MQSCPWCNSVLPPLAARCDTCSRFLPVPAEVGKPACARHPAFVAQGPCKRCGTFSCVACFDGTEFCADCRKLGVANLPWDERRQLGTWKAFWRTVPEVMLRPDKTFAALPPRGGAFESLLFMSLASFLSIVTSVIALGALVGGALLFVGGSAAEVDVPNKLGPAAALGIGAAATAIYLALGFILTFVGVLVISLFDHLLVRLFGGKGDYEVTLRATALTMAPGVVGLLPFCGAYIWPVWALVARVFAYRGMHKLPTAQAVAAAVLPSVGLAVLAVVAYVGLLVATGAYK